MRNFMENKDFNIGVLREFLGFSCIVGKRVVFCCSRLEVFRSSFFSKLKFVIY